MKQNNQNGGKLLNSATAIMGLSKRVNDYQ